MPVAAVRRGCHHHCTASEREFPFPDHPTKTIADASVAVWRPMFELFVGTDSENDSSLGEAKAVDETLAMEIERLRKLKTNVLRRCRRATMTAAGVERIWNVRRCNACWPMSKPGRSIAWWSTR